MVLTLRHERLLKHLCPVCGSTLVAGPRGGAAQNFYCTNRDDCRQGFNVTIYNGVLVFDQDIGEIDPERFSLWAYRGEIR